MNANKEIQMLTADHRDLVLSGAHPDAIWAALERLNKAKKEAR